MAGTGHELAEQGEQAPVLYNGVDPADEPSAAWGWHGGFPRGALIVGWFSVVAMRIMLIGNPQGRVADLWLLVVAALMAFGLARKTIKDRHSWRR